MQGRRRAPLWSKLLVIIGAVMLLASGTAWAGANHAIGRIDSAVEQRDLFGEPDDPEQYGDNIDGPLNILLAGLDTRPSRPEEPARSDTVLIVHIPESMERAYMISVPRDAIVDIPPYEPTNYPGGLRQQLNSAMFHGSKQLPGEDKPDIGRGFELLAQTLTDLTGIARFDAGAVINFTGFTDIVDALDGITVELEQRIVSLHRQPDGTHRPLGCGDYCGPQMVYEPAQPPCAPAREDGSFTCDLNGWQALDIARQRYGVEGGDYGRQQHQQLILMAMLDRAFSRDIVTSPGSLTSLLDAAGEALVFDGRGHGAVDYAFALRDIRPGQLTTVQLEAGGLGEGDNYQGEELYESTYALFQALAQDRLEQFLMNHPDFVT